MVAQAAVAGWGGVEANLQTKSLERDWYFIPVFVTDENWLTF